MISKAGIKIKVYCLGLLLIAACGPDEEILFTTDIIGNATQADAFIEAIYEDMTVRSLFADAYVIMPLLFSDNCYYAGNDNESWQEASDMEIDPDDLVNWQMFTDFYSINNDLNILFAQLDTTDDVTLTEDVKDGFRAEGKAIRAVMYFYLNSYWGNVPLILEDTDQSDTTLPNASPEELFNQIESDLLFAEENISKNEYANNSQRLGGTAVKAWFARFYLQNEEWSDALQYAEEVIQTGTAVLEADINDVYNNSSTEHIWILPEDQLATSFAVWFLRPFTNGQYLVRPRVAIPFEEDDHRRNVALSITGSTVIKYDDISTNSDPAYLFRLSEVYLIAAEAAVRAINDYETASMYLNTVRSRAGLEDISLDGDNFTDVILQERNAEFCYEGFHRLMDLRRFDIAEEVLGEFGYDTKDALWPFPQITLDDFSSLEQNEGY